MELKYIILLIFVSLSLVFLVSLFFKRVILQEVFKCCLAPFILVIYLTGAEKILIHIILALVFGWTGDIFLTKKSDHRRFRLGVICFLFGHIFYIIAMSGFVLPFNVPVLIISVVGAAVYGFFFLKIIRPNKEMKLFIIVYLVVILGMTLCAIQLFLVQGALFGAFVLAGSLFFVASDSALAIFTFGKRPFYGNFLVMFTYIAAQMCIIWGFCTPGI